MDVKVEVKITEEGRKWEARLRELAGLRVRVGFQRGKDFEDAEETEKKHAMRRMKRKKGKGTSNTVTGPRMPPAFPGSKRKSEVGDQSKVDMCDIAMWNELGTRKMPSRPFMRMSVDENEAEITRFVSNCFRSFVRDNKMSAEELLDKLGVYQTGLMQRKIRDGVYAALSPVTIAIKGSDRPLIDTGRMRQSVHHQVMTAADAAELDGETLE